MCETLVFTIRDTDEDDLFNQTHESARATHRVDKAHVWEIVRVGFFIVIEVDFVSWVAEEHDQEDIIKCVIFTGWVKKFDCWFAMARRLLHSSCKNSGERG